MATHKQRILIIGGGSRGTTYAERLARNGATIVGLVEPDPARRDAFVAGLPGHDIDFYPTWQDAAAITPRIADAVVITTPDQLHAEPAIGFARAGFNILLEKPMAPTEAEAVAIADAAAETGVMLAVCHVMRYSKYTEKFKELVDSGVIGQVVSVEHLEPIGWWHFAHSFVRGNWGLEATSAPMLLAKSCHDIDWLAYMIGKKETKVSSFGNLFHFRPENKPAEAAHRCLECPLQQTCAYSATKIYRPLLGDPGREIWPLSVLTTDVTESGIAEALAHGPYGECVYNGQNDVADHQVVIIEYEGGVTASFTAVAFTDLEFRKTRVFGTGGCIEGDGEELRVHEFSSNEKYAVNPNTSGDASAADGHGGADEALIVAFLKALETGDRSHLLSGAQESLRTHQVVWKAEESRKTGHTQSF